MFEEFKKFAMRGSVVDLAVGVIVGASFTGIVNSLVKDIVNPVLGLAIGGIDFSNFFVVLKGDRAVTTLAEAAKAGAVTLNYGVFLNARDQFPDRRLRAVPGGAPDQPADHAEEGASPRPRRRPAKRCCCCAKSAMP